jgi:hypothetical protein
MDRSHHREVRPRSFGEGHADFASRRRSRCYSPSPGSACRSRERLSPASPGRLRCADLADRQWDADTYAVVRRLVSLAGCGLVVAALTAVLASGADSHSLSLRPTAARRLTTAVGRLERQLQRYLGTARALAPPKQIRAAPSGLLPPAGGRTCFIDSDSCSLTPCVEPVGTPRRPAPVNPPGTSAAECSNRTGQPLASQAVPISTEPLAQLSSIRASSATVVANPRTGATISIASDGR